MRYLLLVMYHIVSLHWLKVASVSSSVDKDYPIAKPGCPDRCGNIPIAYPYGIGAKCYQNPSYEIVCNTSSHPPKAFLQKHSLEVVMIQGGHDRHGDQLITVRIPVAGNMCTKDQGKGVPGIDFRGSPYRFSSWHNAFVVWGCSGSVVLKNSGGQILSGCASVCGHNFSAHANINSTNCYGVGCCKNSISGNPIDYYEIFVDQGASPGRGSSTTTCTLSAALVNVHSSWQLENQDTLTTQLEWQVSLPDSHQGVSCLDHYDSPPTCSCTWPYEGNPYLDNGCQARRECRKCKNHCSYNDTTRQYYCQKNLMLKPALFYAAGLVLLIPSCYGMYRWVKRRRDIKRKEKNFKRNGGLLLQQQMSSNDGTVEKATVFTTADLEKGTDNFNESRVLGQGGQGTVYKGMLMDGRIVAIKKSIKVNVEQLNQFINEMVILSQVNHRNVVKLIGCCLETKVPLIVYEFIPNGTLHEHIHDPTEDFHITWKMRLQIAAESAGTLAYLHSASSTPIYHRDIKSSNILLDERYRAKVSDFGTSRAIKIEQTHVTTRIQGTYGYLDPEYFRSNQFTEKSDVYSFGVVLAELITGKKPIFFTESGERKSLSIEFVSQVENSHPFDFVDARIVEEAKEDELLAVAELARKCLNMNGRLRPTMQEVERALDAIRSPNSNAGQIDDTKGKCVVVTEIEDYCSPSSSLETTFFTATDSLASHKS